MLGNATIVSIVYLAGALIVELFRRFTSWRWPEKATLALDSLPGRTLEILGLMAELRRAYGMGELNEAWVRAAFGVTTIAIIFAIAIAVGFFLWLLRLSFERLVR